MRTKCCLAFCFVAALVIQVVQVKGAEPHNAIRSATQVQGDGEKLQVEPDGTTPPRPPQVSGHWECRCVCVPVCRRGLFRCRVVWVRCCTSVFVPDGGGNGTGNTVVK